MQTDCRPANVSSLGPLVPRRLRGRHSSESAVACGKARRAADTRLLSVLLGEFESEKVSAAGWWLVIGRLPCPDVEQRQRFAMKHEAVSSGRLHALGGQGCYSRLNVRAPPWLPARRPRIWRTGGRRTRGGGRNVLSGLCEKPRPSPCRLPPRRSPARRSAW